MTETQAPAPRSDMDIHAEVDEILLHYPPLNNDRFHLEVSVSGGIITISGYVKTMNTHSYLVKSLRLVPGVVDLNTEYLFIDDLMRLDAGRAVPVGISVWAEYGTVVLSGRLPSGAVPQEIAERVGTVPGVIKVATSFY